MYQVIPEKKEISFSYLTAEFMFVNVAVLQHGTKTSLSIR
jgi:hypothetical protein